MYRKFLFLFYIFLINLKLSQQDTCFLNGYNLTNQTTMPIWEMCKAFSYQFNNSICYYNQTDGTCLNITEDSQLIQNKNYSLAKISNNCGTAGFFEPLNEGACRDIPLVDARCCFVNYKDNLKENHTVCLRTTELKKEENVVKALQEHIKTFGNYEYISSHCKGENSKYDLNIGLIFLILLFSILIKMVL